MVSAHTLQVEYLRRRYLSRLDQPDVFPSARQWQTIIDERMHGLGPLLYRKYLVSRMLPKESRSGLHTSALRHFPEYLRVIDHAEAVDTVYADCHTDQEAFIELVTSCQLFDARRILQLLDCEADNCSYLHLTARLLDAYQPQYDVADLHCMQQLLFRLQNLPALGAVEERRNLLGQTTMRYRCPMGHTNPHSEVYCTTCGLDIRGLSEADENAIDNYTARVEALDDLLHD